MPNSELTHPCLLTIGTCNRHAGITVLVQSFLKHHPSAHVFVCLVDRPNTGAKSIDLPASVLYADELALPAGRRFLFKYPAFELCCALKPYVMSYLMNRFTISHLLYLDSDILVTAPFWDDLQKSWADHAILLTPHWVGLPLDLPVEFQRSVVQHGMYNGGFVAIKQGPDTRRFLDCWANLLESQCTFDPMNNIYVDQRWLDLLAASSSAVGVLRDPGVNVGYWNLYERRLCEDKTSGWSVDDKPLKFFHFSGFDRDRVTTKVDCSHEAAAALGRYYGILLDAAGEQEFGQLPYGWNLYCDGTPIPPEHRDLILGSHPELKHIENPFDLPTMLQDWKTIQRLVRSTPPVRISQRYRDSQKVLGTFKRLYRHPLIGPIWRVWRRLVNPSLGADLPPYVRS